MCKIATVEMSRGPTANNSINRVSRMPAAVAGVIVGRTMWMDSRIEASQITARIEEIEEELQNA